VGRNAQHFVPHQTLVSASLVGGLLRKFTAMFKTAMFLKIA
jgi:hypothetical protein